MTNPASPCLSISSALCPCHNGQVLGAGFGSFYSNFVPLAMDILMSTSPLRDNGSERVSDGVGVPNMDTLRGKAMEAIAMIGHAVGIDVFRADAHQASAPVFFVPPPLYLSTFGSRHTHQEKGGCGLLWARSSIAQVLLYCARVALGTTLCICCSGIVLTFSMFFPLQTQTLTLILASSPILIAWWG